MMMTRNVREVRCPTCDRVIFKVWGYDEVHGECPICGAYIILPAINRRVELDFPLWGTCRLCMMGICPKDDPHT